MYKDNKTFLERILSLIRVHTSTIEELVEDAEQFLDEEKKS